MRRRMLTRSPIAVAMVAAGVILVALLVSADTFTVPVSGEPTIVGRAPERPGYRLVFDDEFDGDTLDNDSWHTAMPWGDITYHEQQRYTADALEVRDGMLTITAREAPSTDRRYTSGVIASFERFHITYGRVEMRAMMPAGRGLWPALWLVAKDMDLEDEIDVVEVLGDKPERAYMTLHYPSGETEGQFQKELWGPDLSKGFHTFAVDWRPEKVTWYVDGKECFRVTEKIPATPMHVIANLAVGGPDTWPGAPDDSATFPAEYRIDYIRVYQRR